MANLDPLDQSEEYDLLARLEDLESLLEDLEEAGVMSLDDGGAVPSDLQERMQKVGARDVQQVRDKIMRLHAELDNDDSDLTISES